MSDWASKIRAELERGIKAEAAGNDGMARVCARRAAGWAANAYLERKGLDIPAISGFEILLYLMESDLVSGENRERMKWLTRSLEKNESEGESYWPLNINLLEEAEKLAKDLLPEISL